MTSPTKSDFKDLGLTPELLSVIEECGYKTPTPIQEKAIPVILMSRDIIGQAQTGSGKTASFTLPMIDILSGGKAKAMMPRSLILAPTRELAAQVAENFDTYGKNHDLDAALLVGGESIREQKKILGKGVDVLIATPGRLMDLFEQGEILLNDIKILVIDEADRMLDMGFIPDIEKIISFLPFQRQTLLFSATMPDAIRKLADKFLSNPKFLKMEREKGAEAKIEQKLLWVSPREKKKVLTQIFENWDVKNAFVFCNRKRDVDDLNRYLKSRGFKAQAMHGDMPQSVRTQTLKDFKEGNIRYLICSDVAARGLDVEAVSHVFNYDPPFNPEDYVHRIGRTGRAGQSGIATTLATQKDTDFIEAIQKETGLELQEIDVKDIAHGKKDKSKTSKSTHRQRDDKIREKIAKHNKNQEQKQDSASKDKTSHSSNKSPKHEKPVGFGDDIPAFLKR